MSISSKQKRNLKRVKRIDYSLLRHLGDDKKLEIIIIFPVFLFRSVPISLAAILFEWANSPSPEDMPSRLVPFQTKNHQKQHLLAKQGHPTHQSPENCGKFDRFSSKTRKKVQIQRIIPLVLSLLLAKATNPFVWMPRTIHVQNDLFPCAVYALNVIRSIDGESVPFVNISASFVNKIVLFYGEIFIISELVLLHQKGVSVHTKGE